MTSGEGTIRDWGWCQTGALRQASANRQRQKKPNLVINQATAPTSDPRHTTTAAPDARPRYYRGRITPAMASTDTTHPFSRLHTTSDPSTMVSLSASTPPDHSCLIDPPSKTSPTSRSPTNTGFRPSNDDIEAVIQMATSAHAAAVHLPPRDTRTQLFVGNLPYRVRWQDLKDLFRRAGTVLRADVSLAPDNRSRGYGTVLLATAEDAGRAVDMFNGFVWQTRTLEVRLDRMSAEDPQLHLAGLSGGVGFSGPASTSPSVTATPFGQPKMTRIPSSPPPYPAEDKYLKTASPPIYHVQPSMVIIHSQ